MVNFHFLVVKKTYSVGNTRIIYPIKTRFIKLQRVMHDSILLPEKHQKEKNHQRQSAAMGIRTPVAGVKGPHDWPDYTIAATCSY